MCHFSCYFILSSIGKIFLIFNIAYCAILIAFFYHDVRSIIETIMVTAFDSIQLPFDRVSTPTIRLYYIDMIRSPLMIFSLSLVILSTTKNLLMEAVRNMVAAYAGTHISDHLTFASFLQKVIHDCKAIMTYSSIFNISCFALLLIVSPKKKESEKRPLLSDYEFRVGQEDDVSLEFNPPSPQRENLRYRRVLSAIGSIDEENEIPD